MIPNYLDGIAVNVKELKECTTFRIKCPCGCDDFLLFKRKKSPTEQKKEQELEQYIVREFGRGFEMQSDSKGKVYMIKRNFWGKIVKKVDAKNFEITFKNYISVKCTSCGTEYVLFDETLHGYDALTENSPKDQCITGKNYSKSNQKIEISVYYNNEADDVSDLGDRSLGFERIKIIKIIDNKKTKIFDWECA